MISNEGSTLFVKLESPGAAVYVLGRGQISHRVQYCPFFSTLGH